MKPDLGVFGPVINATDCGRQFHFIGNSRDAFDRIWLFTIDESTYFGFTRNDD